MRETAYRLARNWVRPTYPKSDLDFTICYGRFPAPNIHTYYRQIIPGLKLREYGFCNVILDDEAKFEDRLDRSDVVVLNRPNMREEVESIDMMRAVGKVVVLDTDDYVHLAWTLTPQLEKVWDLEHIRNFENCVRLADLVTVSVPPLADRMEELGARRVAVLDNALDPRSGRWDVAWPEDDGRVRITWSAGWTHAPDADQLAPVIKRVLAAYPQAVFKTIGYMPLWIAELDPDQLEVSATGGIIDYPRQLVGTDIGLGPLKEIPFNDYRSSVKAWEYTAAGAAFVGSRFGPYARDLEHDLNGLLCSSEDEWVDAISELIEDPKKRHRLWRRAVRDLMYRSIDWKVPNFYLAYRAAIGDRLQKYAEMRRKELVLPWEIRG